jgi:DNA-binding protein H-NS
MTTLESLQAKIKKLEQQAGALVVKQSSGVIEKIRGLMAKHGLTTADIDAHVGGKKGKSKSAKGAGAAAKPSAAKYLDPKTGATWSGHGRAPGWIANAKDRSKFLLASNDSAIAGADGAKVTRAATVVRKTSATKAASARKGQPKGAQPALYRDPKSGSTWSGRGRAPAWLATVKDRSRFLIDSAAATAAVVKAGGPKAIVKKAAAKDVPAESKAVGGKKVPTESKTVAGKKVPTKKSSAASPKVATKETAAAPVKRLAVKKVAVRNGGSADVVAVSPDATTVPDVSPELTA